MDTSLTGKPALIFKWCFLILGFTGIIIGTSSKLFNTPFSKDDGLGIGAIMASIFLGIGVAFHFRQRVIMKTRREHPDCKAVQKNGWHNIQLDMSEIYKTDSNLLLIRQRCSDCKHNNLVSYTSSFTYTDEEAEKNYKMDFSKQINNHGGNTTHGSPRI